MHDAGCEGVTSVRFARFEGCEEPLVRHAFHLRASAWGAEDVGALEHDEHDQHAIHWLALDGSRVVAASRLCIHSGCEEWPDARIYDEQPRSTGKTGILTRLVVVPERRRHGIGHELVLRRLADARRQGCEQVVTSLRPHRTDHYRSLGFECVGVIVPTWFPSWKEPSTPRSIMRLRTSSNSETPTSAREGSSKQQ